jgi:hypothetical protein
MDSENPIVAAIKAAVEDEASNSNSGNNNPDTGSNVNPNAAARPKGAGAEANSCETISQKVEIKTLNACPVVLKEFGQNFLAWKSLIPIYLANESDVADVVSGTLKKPVMIQGQTEFTQPQKAV